MVFHGDYEEALEKRESKNPRSLDAIRVGDLVRLIESEWLGHPVGLVTEIRDLIHDQTNQQFTTVTMISQGREFTFHEKSFELVSKAERQER